MIYIKDKKCLNLPEQVQQNIEDIDTVSAAQADDHSAINTNTNDINALKTQMTSVESITLKGDETNNKAKLYRSNKADMGSIQFKTVNGVGLIGEGDITMGTLSNYVMTSGDQTIAGVKTFSDPIHTNQIANENGGALVRYKDTENVSVYGGVNSKAVIMGSGDRPSYSKDGADFEGKEVALVEDVNNKVVDKDHIADGAVGIDQLGSQVVTTEKVALGAINTPQLADRAVSTDKILDNSVTEAKLDSTYVNKVDTAIGKKQDTLVSGTNIKTINNESVLGSGNIPLCTQANWDLLMANLGIGRWANQNLYSTNWTGGEGALYDNMSNNYTSLIRYLDGATFYNFNYTGTLEPVSIIHLPTFNISTEGACYSFMFANMGNTGTLELNDISIRSAQNIFAKSKFSKILVKDGATVDMYDGCAETFAYCSNLTEIGPICMCHTLKSGVKIYAQDGAQWYRPMFRGCPKLKSIHCTHWGLSFDISCSTAFEEADLVEIISNLDLVSTTQTLTMGATNLAKLTSEEILVATGKGWQLA